MVTVPRSHERGSEKLNALHRFDVDQTLTPVRARESWGYSVHGNHVIIGTTLLENGYGGGIMNFGFFTEHYTSCGCCRLRDVWVSQSDCIYIDGPNPWKAWLQDEQYYAKTSLAHNKNFAKVALMSRLNTEVVLLVLQF